LLPGDYGQTGLKLNVTSYAQIWSWTDIKLGLENSDIPADLGEYAAEDILLGGQPVLDLVFKELGTTHVKEKTLGPLKRVLEFDNPVELEIKGKTFKTQQVRFGATRVCSHKRKRVELFGDGVYDWQNKNLTVPNDGQIFGSPWKGDYSDWEEYDGAIPPDSSDPFRLLIVLYRLPPDIIPENPLGAIYETPTVFQNQIISYSSG
jgi:hypothetical protein